MVFDVSGVSKNTISRLERGNISPTLASIIAILRALDLIEQLDTFLPPPQPLKLRRHKEPLARERVRKPKKAAAKAHKRNWRWGDEE